MAIALDEVKKLAHLSRLALSDAELEGLRKDIDSILAYVAVIQKVEVPSGVSPSPHLPLENVMREDGGVHAPGAYTEKMLAQAPRREGRFLKVKKILG